MAATSEGINGDKRRIRNRTSDEEPTVKYSLERRDLGAPEEDNRPIRIGHDPRDGWHDVQVIQQNGSDWKSGM
jgi:hypothetical protein